MGNRLSRTDSSAGTTNYAYNAANMLTGSTGANASSYTDDADGDTLTGGGRVNTWDAQNRMTACALNGPTTTFTYGADGLRRSMTAGGVTTYYVYDGQSMVREMQRNASGVLVPTATYLTGPRGPEYRRDDTRTETDGQGHTFGVTRWYVYDGLGSVVGEVDPLGNVTCSDEYDVYGAVRGRAGTATTAHGFVGGLGHLSDASTGLVYMRARYYDPSTGRFASEDPDYDDHNWFICCDNNPVNEVDPSGKAGEGLSTGALLWILAEALGSHNLLPEKISQLVEFIGASKAALEVVNAYQAEMTSLGALSATTEAAEDADPRAAMEKVGYTCALAGVGGILTAIAVYQLFVFMNMCPDFLDGKTGDSDE